MQLQLVRDMNKEKGGEVVENTNRTSAIGSVLNGVTWDTFVVFLDAGWLVLIYLAVDVAA